MKKMMLFVMLLAVVMLEGCATMPTQSELANCHNGPYPDNYQEIVKEYFGSILFDPYSAVYKFERAPEQGWGKRPPLSGGGLYCGWMVIVGVNAKNRMGGYVGMKSYQLLIKDGSVIGKWENSYGNWIGGVF